MISICGFVRYAYGEESDNGCYQVESRMRRFRHQTQAAGCESDYDLQRGHAYSGRSEEHTSELQSHSDLVCRLLLEKKKKYNNHQPTANQIHTHKDDYAS